MDYIPMVTDHVLASRLDDGSNHSEIAHNQYWVDWERGIVEATSGEDQLSPTNEGLLIRWRMRANSAQIAPQGQPIVAQCVSSLWIGPTDSIQTIDLSFEISPPFHGPKA